MPSENNEAESVNSKTKIKTKASHESLSLIDSDKLGKKTKSTDDVSLLSESTESKSSSRRSGRKKIVESSSHLSVSSDRSKSLLDPYRNDHDESTGSSNEFKLNDGVEENRRIRRGSNESSSNSNDVTQQNRRSRRGSNESSSKTRQRRSRSRESMSSRETKSSVSPSSRCLGKSSESSEDRSTMTDDDSKPQRRASRRDGSKRIGSSDEKGRSSRRDVNKQRHTRQKDDSSNLSYNEGFESISMDANFTPMDDSGFNETFTSFALTNTNDAFQVNGNSTIDFSSAFSQSQATFPSTVSEFTSTQPFDTGFPTEPSFTNFDNNNFAPAATNDSFTDFKAFEASDDKVKFSKSDKPKDITWAHSPHKDVPPARRGEIKISKNIILSKDFECAPISNPLNDNVIFCCYSNNNYFIKEIDTKRTNMQVASLSILTDEVRNKIFSKHKSTIFSIKTILTLKAGLHVVRGRTRVRIASIIDFNILESSTALRLALIWRWGYGIPLLSLQFALLMPTVPTGTDYDFQSLMIADDLIFLPGMSSNGALIFISKPIQSETWSVNQLSNSTKIIKATISQRTKRREFPYMALAFADGSVSIWTYKTALSSSALKDSGVKRILPLCTLDHKSVLAQIELTSLTDNESVEGNGAATLGDCSDLVWIPQSHPLSQMMLLAVAFHRGAAVFHIALPGIQVDETVRPWKEPSPATALSETPSLSPVAAIRWNNKYSSASLCWYWITSQIGPCFNVALGDKNSSDVILLSVSTDFDGYQRENQSTMSVVPLRVVCKDIIAIIGNKREPGLLRSGQSSTTILFTQISLLSLNLTSSQIGEGYDLNCVMPITSSVPGVSSLGEATGEDETGEILYVVKSVHCERRPRDSTKSEIFWGSPVLRFWIARAYSDNNKTSTSTKKKQDSEFEESSQSFAEANTELVCELYHKDLIGLHPFRMVKIVGSSLCAAIYGPTLERETNNSSKPMDHLCRKTAFIDTTKKDAVLEVIDGRDIVFFDSLGIRSRRGLLLGDTGSSLSVFQWDGENPMKITNTYRPILGVECDKDYIECKRLFLFGDASSFNLFVVGKHIQENRLCLLIGESSDSKKVAVDFNVAILPNFVKGPWYWLDEREELLSAISLENDGAGNRNIALATTKRILILSPSLVALSEKAVKLSCSQIAPLGAFGVCFEADNKVQYLCCLDGSFRHGSVASFSESDHRPSQSFLCAIRPDRLFLIGRQVCIGQLEHSVNTDSFQLPTLIIKPVLMLEALIANAVSFKGNQHTMISLLRTVIERFGRKVSLIAHAENEGLGQKGAGLTEKVFKILQCYGLHDAYSWLLTGIAQFDISANSVVLPPWIPIGGKSTTIFESSEVCHILANGDSDVLEYLKSSDTMRPVTLLRISDPMSYLSEEYAKRALTNGSTYDALKMLDLGSKDSLDMRLIQLSIMLQRNSSKQSSFNHLYKAISGYDGRSVPQSTLQMKPPKSMSALLVSQNLKNKAESKVRNVVKWMEPLAPSIQRGPNGKRTRQQLLGQDLVTEISANVKNPSSKIWPTPCNESRHFWNEGPQKDRRKLLLLDRLEDWLERRRPLTIGEEGALATQDRGEKTLADLLNKMDDSFGERDDIDSVKDIWVEGVGEGRSDESNLSGYFRFSEGEDEECQWKKDGLVDLSPYQNKAVVVGDPEMVNLEVSTSSVDEGEQGKVKSLYDLVFLASGSGAVSGLAISAPRGGSLDIGLLHSSKREARAKCTIEFWFFLPKLESFKNNLVLARRTMGKSANDFSKVCLASQSECVLWELRLLTSGEIDFRSCDGSKVLVTKNDVSKEQSPNEADFGGTMDIVAFERWNHVALVLSSKGLSKTQCEVKIFLKGNEVTTSIVSFIPSDFDESVIENDSILDDLLQDSQIVFGLDHPPNFRLTELRFWACSRTPEDVQSFLYEYLTAAEQKKKFKVKITNKGKRISSIQKFGFAPPKGALNDTNQEGALPQRGMIPMKSGGLVSFVNKSVSPEKRSLTSLRNDNILEQKELPSDSFNAKASNNTAIEDPISKVAGTNDEYNFGFDKSTQSQTTTVPSESVSRPSEQAVDEDDVEEDDSEVTKEGGDNAPMTLWDTALALSQQIRPSAAAALIRGPPATRHYGGNRGGLPDFSGADRFGVGGIAICGSEKTIVFRDNEDPPALTYPIGASGAVVSDQMDDEGSEFLCCFLANEKRMVVFELRSRTVVVELQMTTKLNFWRYLPPEAAENTLCFMLITPVGGFHWMPLEESPRPHQIWKRGSELQGKKIVGYEEGGTNGLDDHEIRSNVGLVLATKTSGGGFLEAWIVPIAGDSRARLVSENLMGACLCQPLIIDDGSFLPLIVAVYVLERTVVVNLFGIIAPSVGSIELGDVEASHEIDISEYERDFEPPPLAMGTYPEALCVSLSNIIVVMLRSKGVIAAFELEEDQLNLIAQEYIDHYIIDAVMRYSAEVGGAEIVMLLADNENQKDGRIVSFCFRSAV